MVTWKFTRPLLDLWAAGSGASALLDEQQVPTPDIVDLLLSDDEQ